jgi:hypothetical protein
MVFARPDRRGYEAVLSPPRTFEVLILAAPEAVPGPALRFELVTCMPHLLSGAGRTCVAPDSPSLLRS